MLDTLIRGAKIVDGTGKAAFTADVGILDGMIEAVGNLSGAQAFGTIEAAGRVLTPGFIDMHRHADAALFREGFGEAELCQGLTTLVNGNCGMSLAPLSGAHADECAKYLAPITGNIPPELRFASIDSYFKAAQGRGLPLSCAELIGMGTLRTLAAGFTTGDLSPLELRDLHYHMEAALADGACGVSLGLGYAPEIFYSTDGLIRALAPLHRSGVPICVHMRQEGDGVVDALREMLEVARALQTPLEVSHLKAIGSRNARKAVPQMLSLIEKARQDGLDVMCDVYPYTAGSTQLIHVLPPEFQEGGTEALTKRLLDDAARKEMRARMEAGSDFENITLLVGFDNVIAIGLQMDEYRRFEGKSVAEIAQTRYLISSTLDRLWTDCETMLTKYHREHPLHAGMRLAEARQRLLRGKARENADAILACFAREGKLTLTAEHCALADFSVHLTKRQSAIREELLRTCRAAGILGKKQDALCALFDKKDRMECARVLESLLSTGELVLLAPELCVEKSVLDAVDARVKAWFETHDTLMLGEFRDALGTSRDHALLVLEYYDRRGILRREGDVRRLGAQFGEIEK